MLGSLYVSESAAEVVSLVNYTHNSLFLCGFSTLRRPIAVITPRREKHKRITTRSALSDGGGIVVDKELVFTPSFGDYLKAMESVKINRDNNDNDNDNSSGGGGIHSNSNRRKKKCVKKFVEEEEQGNDEVNAVQENSRKGDFYKKRVFSREDSRKSDFREEIEMEKVGNKKNKDFKIPSAKRSDSSERTFSDMDRAAFKSLEHEDDIIGKAKVTKADMEERIQKLAKCLNGADINMPEWKFSEMMRSAQIRFSDHSIMRVIQILGNLGNWRRVLQVIEWIQSRERFKSHKIRYIYTAALDALGKARRPVESLNLFWRMQEQMDSYPDKAAYHCIAVTLGQAGYMKELFDVIDTMRSPPKKKFKTDFLEKWDPRLEPDVIVYNAVLNACVWRKKWEGAFWVLQQLSQQGQQPSCTTYGLVMEYPQKVIISVASLGAPPVVHYLQVLYRKACCLQRFLSEFSTTFCSTLKKIALLSIYIPRRSYINLSLLEQVMLACGKYNLVHDFFKKVQKSYIPNALIYKVVVNTLWRESKIDEAVMAVDEMERRGIVGNAGLYYDLARCLCSAGRCHEALKQIDKICKVANKPLVVAYTGLIQACLESGYIEDGAYIFNHMQKFCSPNLVTCNIMLKAFLDHGRFEEAKQLFLTLLENGNLISSEEDYKVRVIPDIYSFNTMLDACAVEKKWDDLEFAYAQMLKYGHHFNAKRHLRLILDARRAGKESLLEMAWKRLIETERLPHPLLVVEMLCMRLEHGDYAAALSYVVNFASFESQVFSRKSWLKLFVENAHRFQDRALEGLVHEGNILLHGSENPALEHLVDSCKEFLRTQRVSIDIGRVQVGSRSRDEAPFVC